MPQSVPPSQKIQSGSLPGVQNARPAPDAARISLMQAMGGAFERFGKELSKGIAADPTELAKAKAMITQSQQALKGFGAAAGPQGPPQSLGGPGAPRRDVDMGVDPHTQNPMNSVPSGGGNQPFVT